jgi:hypothetical protein
VTDKKYRMTLSLNVLNHLGLNLYSNASAVLSEVVANSWDADAAHVTIAIDQERIEINDDGQGMRLHDINEKFLTVGYRRRDHLGENITPKFKREVMGRKGIGKLSLFSIARCVQIFSVKNGEKNAFEMDVDEIKKKIEKEQGTYFPKELNKFPNDLKCGTRIVLTDFKKHVLQTRAALRKRLARRFSILGSAYNFEIKIDETPVTIADRDYIHKIQFLWTYGPKDERLEKLCEKIENLEKRDGTVLQGKYEISGWIGAVKESGHLKDEFDNLNKILIMVRGKVAQEDILDEFNEGGMYTKYLIGEIHADFLDRDDDEDIATSSRQRIKEDEARYTLLKDFLYKELKNIQNQWTDLRNEEGQKKALEILAVKEWFESLPPDSRKRARSLFGKINQLTIDSEEERKRLFKHSILAFESLRYRENLDALDAVGPEDLVAFTSIFENLDDIEATLYYQIVNERLQVIEALRAKVEKNELEKIIQKHLFEHLWLLDSSWERASGTEYMEKLVSKEFKKVDAGLTSQELKARLDIKYRTASGKHVIIELKRADRKLDTAELLKQAQKYNSALRKLLDSIGKMNEPIEIICIVGQKLKDWQSAADIKNTADSLKPYNARVVLYQELLKNAYHTYHDFLEKKKEAGRVLKVIQSIDAADLT